MGKREELSEWAELNGASFKYDRILFIHFSHSLHLRLILTVQTMNCNATPQNNTLTILVIFLYIHYFHVFLFAT